MCSWEKDIFVLRSHHFDGFYFVSARLTEYDRAGRREKKLWEGMEAALMCRWRPAECSAGLVAMLKAQSATGGGFDKLLVWHGHRVGVGFRSKSSTMVACLIPVSYEMAIQNSMTLGTGEKWFLPRWRHPLRPEHQWVFPPFTKQAWCLPHILCLSAIIF